MAVAVPHRTPLAFTSITLAVLVFACSGSGRGAESGRSTKAPGTQTSSSNLGATSISAGSNRLCGLIDVLTMSRDVGAQLALTLPGATKSPTDNTVGCDLNYAPGSYSYGCGNFSTIEIRAGSISSNDKVGDTPVGDAASFIRAAVSRDSASNNASLAPAGDEINEGGVIHAVDPHLVLSVSLLNGQSTGPCDAQQRADNAIVSYVAPLLSELGELPSYCAQHLC
jgi:hypothetical protein